ncbi:MAG: 23S rRNA (pseudouridine(1915)-N(3))-methyltransferase RlmH [Acholeplasmataceae bacterium]
MTIIAVGKMTTKGLSDAMNHYKKQLRDLEIIEVKESSMKDEADKIMKLIKPNDFVITLEIEGKSFSSESLAELLKEKKLYLQGRIVYVIGGSDGLDDSIKRLSHLKISMSKMTFPHQLARVMLVEQIYRAQKILEKHPYHK